MPISEKRLAANRANAAKSTGPRTPEGKRNSSRNAARHGMLSNAVVIEGESRARFVELLTSYEEEFRPVTPTEQSLVETMVVARWRMLRVWALESAGMTYEIKKQSDAYAGENTPTRVVLAMRHLGDGYGGRQHELMNRYETRFDRQFHRAAERLAQMRAERNRREKTPVRNEPTSLQEGKDRAHETEPAESRSEPK